MTKCLRVGALLLVLVLAGRTAAAVVVTVNDPAMLGKNIFIAIVHEYILGNYEDTYAEIRRFARRLSVFFPMDRYIPDNPPLWRTWRQDDPTPEALAFMETLNTGVGLTGADTIAPARIFDPEFVAGPSLEPSLAWLDLADSALVAGVDQTGRIRGARRGEREAIEALEDAVTAEGGTNSRLEVLNAGALIGARQRQTGLALAGSLVEQLAVEAIKVRQVDVARHRMRQESLAPPVNLLAGSAQQLAAWRQP